MIRWIGGKYYQAPWIIQHFAKHQWYVEVFGGMGWVLLRKPPSNREYFNDINENIINLFYQVVFNKDEFKERLKYFITAEKIFDEVVNKFNNDGLSSIDKAVYYAYIICNSVIGDERAKKKFSLLYANGVEPFFKRIDWVADRLRRVKFSNLDYRKLLDMFDYERVLFYLDPPYYLKNKNYYRNDEFNHQELADRLKNLKRAKFILSYNSHPDIKELYKGFSYDEKPFTKFSSGSKEKPDMNELLIYNYDLAMFDKKL